MLWKSAAAMPQLGMVLLPSRIQAYITMPLLQDSLSAGLKMNISKKEVLVSTLQT